ncbi:D-alanyl-D-alanine carboxypeptidase family protein [uncultured Sphingomonas sp.]|uniref:D-alanyl-D-alanine carboxypeptidase family protein n=1 Tax=uncultured Sphingomonas sp. TaxID=158754 RepID=UPI0026372657|nr:D-alanyl-D-alanine carboxypeptidase family protein [uncultured Sphingomonas sp.]
MGALSPVQAAAPRYAAFMVDANTREVLYSNAPDELRHPASLTKMMTLYLTFDAVEAGRMRISDPVTVSAHAASQRPSRLGLKVGQSLSVDNAISVVAVKSCNDIAVALAEKLGGNEQSFVGLMNAKAMQLGMRNTHFDNASGLPDPANVTTARDLTILALALIHDHPRFYRYFGQRDYVWQNATMINHNHLLGKMAGLDGIKTGYTVDSGFTLAASAQRGNRRLVAVVLGEPSLVVRNRDAQNLLEAGFSVLDRRGVGQAVTVASVLPQTDHSALRLEPPVDQGASDEPDTPMPARRAVQRAAPDRHAPERHAHGRRDRARDRKAEKPAARHHDHHVAKSHEAAKKSSSHKRTRRHTS